MVVLAFQERGIEVITVGNGEAAVRRIPDANPDLVLADVFMPVRNGYEVCEFVKKDPRFSGTPVILLVGAFDPLDEKEARRVGADGVLKKPFVPPDPLIAMVMSALEKNPKVVAELARAKEAKEQAAAITSIPAAAMESPATAEVKPLPEFPEPSPEEAAMIYGFGKGVRAIDAEGGEEDEDEVEEKRSKKSKAAQGLKDPQEGKKKSRFEAPPPPKTPVAQMEDEEEEEEFDGSATASDWRRNAADLEVPENVEANPIYSYGKNFEPITFPSERDVPPKRVKPEQEAAEAVSEEKASSESAAATAEVKEAASSDAAANWELTTEEESKNVASEIPAVDAASPLAAPREVEASSPMAETQPAAIAAPEPEAIAATPSPEAAAVEAAKEEPQGAKRPSFVARVRGWMDMMSPSSDEAPTASEPESREQHWMTSIESPMAASVSLPAETIAPLNATEVENPVKVAEAEALAETAAEPAVVEAQSTVETLASIREEAPTETTIERHHFDAAPVAASESLHSEQDEFAEALPEVSAYGVDTVGVSETLSAPEEPAAAETHFEPVQSAAAEESLPQANSEVMAEAVAETPAEPAVENAPSSWQDAVATPAGAENHEEPADEPATLEPILNDLHEQPFVAAEETEQPPAHLTEWLRGQNDGGSHVDEPQPVEALAAEAAVDSWMQQEPEAVEHEEPFADQHEPSFFAGAVNNGSSEEFTERIPTLPPPNREALSQIPFLVPRPEPDPVAPSLAQESNSAAVDEVVRRVLEKLQPQLHELLSQGVKPLVENILQNELKTEVHKNDR
jgi:CheY-like chemotaxis protein